MPQDATPSRRNQLIDVLRGVSIAMVVACHYPLFWKDSSHTIFGRAADNVREGMGYYGVVIFFVISGFLITGNTLRRYGTLSAINTAEFWGMRFARIYPMLFACLAAMVIYHEFYIAGFAFQDENSLHQAIAAALSFRYNELANWPKGGAAWNPLWSLSIEELFYLAFPLVCLVLDGFVAGLWVCLFIVATACYLRVTGAALPFSAPAVMDLLALGCFTALCRPQAWRDRLTARMRAQIGAAFAAIGAALVVFAIFSRHPFDDNADWGPLCCGVGAAFSLVAAEFLVVPRLLSRVLLPLSLLGVASYELYLIHLPVYTFLGLRFIGSLWWVALFAVGLAFVLHAFYAEPLNRGLRALFLCRSNRERGSHIRIPVMLLRVASLLVAITLIGWSVAPRQSPVTVDIRIAHLAQLPPGTSEPVVEAGDTGAGDLVYLVHVDASHVRVGIDHWGGPLMLGKIIPARQFEAETLRIHLTTNLLTVSQGSNVLIQNRPGVYSTAVRGIGRNDLSFTTSLTKAASQFVRVR